MVLFLCDVGTDIATGVKYLQGEGNDKPNTWWGVITITFAALGLVSTNVVTWWYVYKTDDDEYRLEVKHKWLRRVQVIVFIFQLGLLFL